MPTWLIEEHKQVEYRIVSTIKDQNGNVLWKGSGDGALNMMFLLNRPGVTLTCESHLEECK